MKEFSFDRLLDYSEPAILAEIKRVAEVTKPAVLTERLFEEHGRVSLSTIRNRFHSLHAALTRAGLQERSSRHPSVVQKVVAQRGRGMPTAELLEMAREIAHQIGKTWITVDEFNEHGTVNASTLRQRFGGSWRRALEAAGLSPGEHHHRYDDTECMENLLNVWSHYGRQPRYNEMSKPPSRVGGKAYVMRWKRWNSALRAFIDFVENKNDESEQHRNMSQPQESCSKITSPKAAAAEADVRQIKLGLRYRVLKRDGFTCVLCGRSPALHRGLELHVDHFEPFSRGGKTVEENLRTTCADCNIGKGDRIE